MSLRQEYKFFVPNTAISYLRRAIAPHVIRDDHVKIGQSIDYTVRSVYFDTPRLSEYRRKLAGDRTRKKYRIRGYDTYDENNIVFLEIKHKYDKSITKERAPVYFRDVYDLLNTGDAKKHVRVRPDFPKSQTNAQHFLFAYKKNNLVPIVLTIYEREAYLFKFDHSGRVTFDKNLRGCIYPEIKNLYEEKAVKYPFHNHFILEIKSNYGFPRWAIGIIAELGVKRQALSKYTKCIDAHRHSLCHCTNNETIALSKHPLFTADII